VPVELAAGKEVGERELIDHRRSDVGRKFGLG
jgi:hypothetical protein